MDDTLDTEVAGYRSMLFGLVVKTTILTVLTLGVYSFWARTRLRRWVWSSVRPAGMPMEYTGDAMEKLTGFFVAAVIVAYYVGFVVLGLIYLSLSFTGELTAGALVAVALVLPLFYAARYRGRRYLTNHTRWRALNFSMEFGALGYAWRGVLYLTLTILSFGLLLPLMTFQMHKFVVDRTWYGDDRFFQTGKFTELYKAFLPVLVIVLVPLGLSIWAGMTENEGLAIFASIAIGLGIVPAIVYYRVASFRIMANNIVFADGVEFEVFPRANKVFWTYFFGSIQVAIIVSLALPLFGGMVYVIITAFVGELTFDTVTQVPPILFGLIASVSWITLVILRRELRHVFVTFPILSHTASTLLIEEGMPFADVKRGQKSHMADADGLSGFFDFGGGI